MATNEIAIRGDAAVQQIGGTELEQVRFMPVMSIETAVSRRNVIVQAVAKLMKDGQDFGTIPGTPKPTLYQPGADKLNNLFGLVPRFSTNAKHEDWTGEQHGGEAFFAYEVTCHLYRGTYLMGEGAGSCNSWESKYRYRKSERLCPQCQQPAIIKGKPEYGGGWVCFAKKGGCNAKFKAGDPAIEEQQTGRVANPDIFDQVNTVLKMANKRAKIAATLNATSAHEFFTQDIEDLQREAHDIDTGGHPVGTQGAADYVAQQKIATMPRQSRQSAPPPPIPDAALTPEPVTEMWAGMTTIKAVCDVFASLKGRMVKLMGQSAGEAEYYRLLSQYGGVKHSNELKQKAARQASWRMWESIQQAEGLAVSEADLPTEFREPGDGE